MYSVFFTLSVLCFVISVALAFWGAREYRSTRVATPSRMLVVGVYLSAMLLFFPHYFINEYATASITVRIWESFWLSVYQSIRLFLMSADFDRLTAVGTPLGEVFGTVLLITAPALTFGVILSFFKNFSAYRKYLFRLMSPTYVFSELNERSLALAKDVRRTAPGSVLMFAGVSGEIEEKRPELVGRAKELGAICFKKDVLSLNLRFHSRSSELYFFLMASDAPSGRLRSDTNLTADDENIKQAYRIVSDPYYSKRKNTYLYVFSAGAQGRILFDNFPESEVMVTLVEKHRALITKELYERGKELLFDHAVTEADGTKSIRVAIVGAGDCGAVMIRFLTWYCQVEGYRLSIDVFDIDPTAGDRFAFRFPGLMSPQFNGVEVDGLPRYRITFHSGVSVGTAQFADEICAIDCPTYIMVALGRDELAVRTSFALRRLFRQRKAPHDPIIQTVVYDSENAAILRDAKHWDGQSYGIRYFGDLESAFSVDTIMGKQLTCDAIEIHSKYLQDDIDAASSFHGNIYYRRASISVAMYRKLLCELGLGGCGPESEWSDEELLRFAKNEHCRWVAFMLTEGFVWSGSTDISKRDRLAKMHHELVPFDQLPEERRRRV